MAELDPGSQAEVQIGVSAAVDGAPTIRVAGELDFSNVAALKTAVTSATAAKPERLVFELGGLRFIDSAGVAALVEAVELVPHVALSRPSPPVRRVVELTGLTNVLAIEP